MSKIVMMNYNIKYLSKKSYIIYTLSKIVKYIYFILSLYLNLH